MDSAQHPSLPPEGAPPICPRCRAPLVPRDDGDGGQWTHQCPECGQVYDTRQRRGYEDKQLRPTEDKG